MYETSNKIRLSKVVDFYYLETLLSLVSTQKSSHHPRLKEKLETDLRYTLSDLSTAFSTVLVDYLTFACMGEASEANEVCDHKLSESLEHYEYTRESILKACRDLFNGEFNWSDSYGGDAWGHIAEYALEYYSIPSLTAWLDHIFDVEHNGGELFDKSHAAKKAGLLIDFNGKEELCDFLSFKFECPNILEEHTKWSGWLSRSTRKLIVRYSNIFDTPASEMLLAIEHHGYTNMELFRGSFVTWGERTYRGILIETESREECSYCGDMSNADNMLCCEKCSDYVCDECTESVRSSSGFSYVCHSCYVNLPKCKNCEVKIFYSYESEMCDDCNRTNTECSECEDVYPNEEINEDGICEKCVEEQKSTCKICGHNDSTSTPVYECGYCGKCISYASLHLETGKPTTGITAWVTYDHFGGKYTQRDIQLNSDARGYRSHLLQMLRDNGNDYLALMILDPLMTYDIHWQYNLFDYLTLYKLACEG